MSQHLLTRRPARRRPGLRAAAPGLSARTALGRRRPESGVWGSASSRDSTGSPSPSRDRLAGRAGRLRRAAAAAPDRRTPSSSASPTWSPPTSPRAPSRRRCRRSSSSPSSSPCREAGGNPAWRDAPLRFVPAALIAVGSAYTYSYPGPVWLAVAAAIWMGIGLARDGAALPGPAPWRAAGLALLAFAVLVAPEIGRMVEFHNFETFDPNGPGLGNLFGQVSPFEALGIWPSGDFRLSPGDGAVPALGYYLGAAFALDPARLRPRPLLAAARDGDRLRAGRGRRPLRARPRSPAPPTRRRRRSRSPRRSPPSSSSCRCCGGRSASSSRSRPGGCSLLALANAPVGPTDYSPALTGLRPLVADGSTLVLASDRLLDEEQGERYIVWELRGGRVCIEAASEASRHLPAQGTKSDSGRESGGSGPPPASATSSPKTATAARPSPACACAATPIPTCSGKRRRAPHGQSDCPLIAVRQARQARPLERVTQFARLCGNNCVTSTGSADRRK